MLGLDEGKLGIRSFHESGRPRFNRTSRGYKTTRGTTPKASRIEPEQAWPEAQAETQEAFRLGPRFKVLVFRRFPHLTGDFGESQALANNAGTEGVEAVTVIHPLPMVESESLLIHVPKQMEWLHADVGSAESALHQTPEVLKTVGMDVAANIGLSVVDELMNVVGAKAEVSVRLIGEQMSSRLDVLADRHVHAGPASILHHVDANLTATLQERLHWNFAGGSASLALHDALLAVVMHIANLAADEGLVNFNLTVQLAAIVLILHRQPNALEHKPCGFLADADGAVKFVTGEAVLAIRQLPHSKQPLIQSDSGVLEDGSDLDGELSLRMASLALPEAPRFQKANLLGPAGRAYNAVLPAPRG